MQLISMIFGRAKLNLLVPDSSNYQEHLWRLSHKDPKDLENPEKKIINSIFFVKLKYSSEIKNSGSIFFREMRNSGSFFCEIKNTDKNKEAGPGFYVIFFREIENIDNMYLQNTTTRYRLKNSSKAIPW